MSRTAPAGRSSAALADRPDTEVVARPMSWLDIPVLVDLEAALFGEEAWSARTWWGELAARPRRDYVVVEREGEVLAYAGLDRGGEVADVMTIAVAPSAQGLGLGRELLALLRSRARESGARYLMLEVRADNEAARGLYETSGFEVLTVRHRYYQPDDVDALVMRAVLGEGSVSGDAVSRDAVARDAVAGDGVMA
ncbi:MAG: ribosomal protein S18-alanine N-acetyltransferase [Actinomycetia bacterium]|nr:ribosomal protein S18-alanine N-acetyltransferase [Actinomycetes bacterium]